MLKPHFLEQIKLLQSIFLSEFGWSLSTTWGNVNFSALEGLVKNTFLNSRKGESPQLTIEELKNQPLIKLKFKKATISWETKPVTSVAKNPLTAGLVNFRETLKSNKIPSPILNGRKKEGKLDIKARPKEISVSKFSMMALKDDTSTASPSFSPQRKAPVMPGKQYLMQTDSTTIRKAKNFFGVNTDYPDNPSGSKLRRER